MLAFFLLLICLLSRNTFRFPKLRESYPSTFKFCPFINIYISIATKVCSHLQDILDCAVPEDGGCKHLQNVRYNIRIYTASYPKRTESLQHRCENLRFRKTVSINYPHLSEAYEQQICDCNAHTTRICNLHVYTCSIQSGLKVNNATYRENAGVWSSLFPSNARFETKCRQLPSLHS